jgi:hypothetical protein
METLQSIRDAIDLPPWAWVIALAFVALSPFVISTLRSDRKFWHRSK